MYNVNDQIGEKACCPDLGDRNLGRRVLNSIRLAEIEQCSLATSVRMTSVDDCGRSQSENLLTLTLTRGVKAARKPIACLNRAIDGRNLSGLGFSSWRKGQAKSLLARCHPILTSDGIRVSPNPAGERCTTVFSLLRAGNRCWTSC